MSRNPYTEAGPQNQDNIAHKSDSHDIVKACQEIEADLAEIWVEPSATPRHGSASETIEGESEASLKESNTTRMRRAAKQAAGAKPTTADFPFLSPPQIPDEIGRLESYRVLSVLGEGGMGVVFEAHDLTLDRRVAIKVLRPGETDATLTQRFLQEARLAGSLSSDRVVTIYQVGQQNSALFIVMELLAGEPLDQLLEREHTLPLADALRITREVAEGLAAAHEKKLIHRDIKPANVWLRSKQPNDSYSHIKILDFGIAKPISLQNQSSANRGWTVDGLIIGTPNFMSPEQACGDDLDERSDLFSLGCLLYTMLIGKPPFERDNHWQSLYAVANDELGSIAEQMPTLPPQVVELVDQLLQKNRDARPASARKVLDTLRRIEMSTTGRGLKLPAVADSSVFNKKLEAEEERKIGWGVWIGALTVVAAMLFGAWGAWQHFMLPVSPPNQDANIEVTDVGNPAPEAAAGDDQPLPASADLPPIKIGILHSLSGPMEVTERPIVDAYLFAIEEINEKGGLLGGRRIEPIVRDGESNELVFASEAEKLLTEDKVVTLFGCWRSTCRKSVAEVCARHKNLLVYPTLYEGLEQSPYVIYMGGAPNQQVLPAVKWAFAFLGKRKFFMVGVDGIYSRTVTEIVKDELASLGGSLVGEEYRLFEETDFESIAEKIKQSDADIVLNTVSGSGNSDLFHSLHSAGIEPSTVPVLSFRVTEEELATIGTSPEDIAGNFSSGSYFQSLPSDNNQYFVERFRKRFGADRTINDSMEAAYNGLYAWAAAVYDSNSDQIVKIRRKMINQTVDAPEGLVTVSADNHAIRSAVIGQVTSNLDFDIIWTSPKPIDPQPFPDTRTPEQWQEFQHKLFKGWHDNWRPDAPQEDKTE